MKARIAMTHYGFLANLIRLGIVVGFWLCLFVVTVSTPTTTVVMGSLITAFTAVLIAWDGRKARKQSNPDKESIPHD